MSTVTRRERREQERARRARRPAPQPTRPRRTLYVAAGVVIVVAALIAGGRALGIFGPPPAPADPLLAAKYDVAGATIGTHEADEGNAHVPVGQKVTYKTDPPTSGSHWDQAGVAPVSWGVKDTTQPNEAIVHNLEHGGIVVFYKDLSAGDLSSLSALVREIAQNGYPKMVLEPYPLKDPGIHIALSAWRWSLKLPAYDDVQIVKFVKAHYEGPDAPEPQTP
ncbi:MAG: DUF3105 domain-containing protein [Chloroflexota bacterium]|nr:DUF3105 domain-containing protein [Chloroflexota bacterium]